MSGKRQATSNLNHDNWDQEEEEEQRGTFRTATSDELKNRVIKKARRKVVAGSDSADGGGGAPKSLFSGFAGFGKAAGAPAATAASSPFSFLSKIPAVAASASATPTFSFGGGASATSNIKPKEAEAADQADKKPKTAEKAAAKESSSGAEGADKSPKYYAQLKSLNQAVSDWIKTHVDKNPLCLLTPIFKDYETHLADIDREEKETKLKSGNTAAAADDGKKLDSGTAPASTGISSFKFSSSGVAASTAASAAVSTASTTSFSFSSGSALSSAAPAAPNAKSIFGGTSAAAAAAAEPAKTNGFSFGLKTDDKKPSSGTAASAGFSFGLKTDDKKPAATTGFSFAAGGAAPAFSFGNIQPPAAATATSSQDNEDEEDQPPKVEFKQVVEEDSIYSKKCKVFVKKDGNFADRGVGTLYLKPVKDSDKTQLLVRADTNLGNILVNLILSAGLPAQRMGKNNVMLVCLPMPNVEKPTSMLLRVKSGEEADELLDTIEKHKK